MFSHFFDDPKTLLLGALTGFIFGFLLQKGGVTRFQVINGQFLLKNFTVLKVMLTAIIVGAIGIYGMMLLKILDPGDLHIKNAALLGNAVGGIIFGIGMAILGYCPGTGVAAIGDGSRHAIAGLIGMIVGAGVYAEVHPWMKSRILGVGDVGKTTLADSTGLSPWWFIALLVVIAVIVFLFVERLERRSAEPA
jgi:uncharacterized membrane protein YedE/YeeE